MDAFIGSIMLCPYTFTPSGWATCQGQILQVGANQALYSLLGNQFGGSGGTTFALPDLQGKVPVGNGTFGGETYNVAQTFGAKTHALTVNEMPAHNHAVAEKTAGQTVAFGTPAVTVNANSGQANVNNPANAYWAKSYDAADTSVISSYTSAHNVTMASDAVQVTISGQSFNANNLTTGPAGASMAFALSQPSLVLRYIIALTGIYPTRD